MEEIKDVREIVAPGEVISSDNKLIPGRGAIRYANKIISLFVGLKEIRGKYINVIPLKGIYTPSIGDKIIGKIIDKTAVKWRLDINAKATAVLKPMDALDSTARRKLMGDKRRMSSREQDFKAMEMFDIGDYIICTVVSTDRVSDPVLSTLGEGLGKIQEGIVLEVDAPKIPRIIGKRGSMIKLLKDMTESKLYIAKNGRIWLKGKSPDHELLLKDVIYKIEREAHTVGLTDRIQKYIEIQKKERGLN
ncbi:MAG: exosome complex RNA-binding protein Rrp4 [Promethearchaeota archaeon]